MNRIAAGGFTGGPRKCATKCVAAYQGTARDGGSCGPFCQPGNLTAAEADAKDINRVVQTGVTPHATAICKGLSGLLGLVTQIQGC